MHEHERSHHDSLIQDISLLLSGPAQNDMIISYFRHLTRNMYTSGSLIGDHTETRAPPRNWIHKHHWKWNCCCIRNKHHGFWHASVTTSRQYLGTALTQWCHGSGCSKTLRWKHFDQHCYRWNVPKDNQPTVAAMWAERSKDQLIALNAICVYMCIYIYVGLGTSLGSFLDLS